MFIVTVDATKNELFVLGLSFVFLVPRNQPVARRKRRISASECQFTDEEISLLLSTMDAASFNFGANVGVGVHQISVQAKVETSTSAQTGSASAMATIGKGSVVVTEQRLAN